MRNNGGKRNCCSGEDQEKTFIVYKYIQSPIESLIAGM
jgi:hypothetical protein